MCQFRNKVTYDFWPIGPQFIIITQTSHFETAEPDFLSKMLRPIPSISLCFINHMSCLNIGEFFNIATNGFWSIGPQFAQNRPN